MRVATVAIWLRAAKHDPEHRRTCLAYAINISIAQVGWVALIFLDLPIGTTFGDRGPAHPLRARRTALRRAAVRTHALASASHRGALRAARHHHARRGRARHDPRDLRGRRGRRVDRRGGAHRVRRHGARLRDVVGVLRRSRRDRCSPGIRGRAFPWGYGHIFLFGSVVGVGAGLHVAAQVIAGDAARRRRRSPCSPSRSRCSSSRSWSSRSTRCSCREFDPFHLWLFLGAVAVLAVAVLAVALGRLDRGGAHRHRVLTRRDHRRLRDRRLPAPGSGARARSVAEPRRGIRSSAIVTACPRTSPRGGPPADGGVFAFPDHRPPEGGLSRLSDRPTR